MELLIVNWHSLKSHVFPRFSVIFGTLKKIKAEKAEAILVVPYWTNKSLLITSTKNLLKLTQYPELVHPMWRKIDMVLSHLAGSLQKAKEFQNKLKRYSKHRSDTNKEKI